MKIFCPSAKHHIFIHFKQSCFSFVEVLLENLFIHLEYMFRYRVQSPSSGGEEEEQGATEPESARGRGAERESTEVSVFYFLHCILRLPL